MGMILHDWDLDNKMMLIRKAYERCRLARPSSAAVAYK